MAMNPFQYMERTRARNRREVMSPFGGRGFGYSQNDPNSFPIDGSYNEETVFNGAAIDLVGNLANSALINSAVGKPVGYNQGDHFVVSQLPTGNVATQVLPYNPKRIALTLQNQDAALNLFFTLGAAVPFNGTTFAGVRLSPGQGYIFDNGCVPSDSLYIAWSAGAGVGIVMEGTRS